MKIAVLINTEVFYKTCKQTKRAVPGKRAPGSVLHTLFALTRKVIGRLRLTNEKCCTK